VASATSYELADRIAGDRIAVFKGRRADGVMVLMHQLTPGFDHSDVLKLGIAYMLRKPPANGGLILDLVELDGLTYLVTADKPDCLELPGWLAREVGHALAPESKVTAEVPRAAPQPAAATLVGFTPFLGSVQSTSTTLSPPQATRPPASRGPLLTSSQPKPVGAFTAISGPMALGDRPPEPAPKAAEPSQTSEPQAGPVTPAQSSPEPAPQPAPSTMPPAPMTPSAPEAPAVYLIAQPKAGIGKTMLFTVAGFLVVAAVFWLAMVVVRGMK
jgi:hypothetical protein